MGNGKPENVMCDHSLVVTFAVYTFEWQEELLAIGDLRQGFFH